MSQYRSLLLITNPALRQSLAMNHAAALAKASGASLQSSPKVWKSFWAARPSIFCIRCHAAFWRFRSNLYPA
jgi:hypothetical protein